MFSEAWLYDEVRMKKQFLEEEMKKTSWKKYLKVFDPNFPATVDAIDRMRGNFWGDGTAEFRPLCYSLRYENEYSYQKIGERYSGKRLPSSQYDPVEACWNELHKNVIIFKNLSILHDKSLDGMFEVTMVSSCLVYHWGLSVLSENKVIASAALYEASGLFDVCLGMLYAKLLDEKQKKISKKRMNAGKKGGETKAEAYKKIQQELIKLLDANCPEGKWKTKVAAVEHVFSALWTFVEKVQSGDISSPLSTMNEEKMRDRIAVWSTKGELKEAFKRNVSRKNNK
ncbi:Uncharacterised protein [Klebsiella oxytoca]|nr:Uncharacterised protein [Klebsiella oxytoca]